ncbi:ABC transporter ATP-binding protein [Bifidobacterium aemilianum]|uniref:ABC transporter ATP-binding protein n=1 Tax=Bifidobacterium aemilianum TaxID=2493120 RepID=A0A366K9A5_9BIFI|nr:ABC transporter ATP-binding protein [Bifidobacterium aemilianum]RBP97907.1 ABC transporter ATP-binding protein [Bifidobacterium aemilianum]
MKNIAAKQALPNHVALRVSHVSKDFQLPTERVSSLKGALFNIVRHKKSGFTTQHVLKDVSFEIEKGDFFGIVGKNGSGKSTLLKIISQIYTPNKGSVQVNGKLVPFIELGVGFNPELTGRENVYLNGAMLGFTKTEIDDMYDDIVDFAELGDFMEQKLKNYSSGMQVRLAFSVAIKSQGDILVLDEVLAVGDEAFQKKCQDYFFQAKREKKTIILVTHSMADVRRFCNKAMLIQDGIVKKFGSPNEVADAYSSSFLEQEGKQLEKENEAIRLEVGDGVRMTDVVTTADGEKNHQLDINQDFSLVFSFKCDRDIEDAVLSFSLIDSQGRLSLSMASSLDGKDRVFTTGEHRMTFDIENIFASSDYRVDVAIASGETTLFRQIGIYQFQIKNALRFNESMTHPRVSMTLQ